MGWYWRWFMGRRPSRSPANHFLVRGSVDGWFICACGCGFVVVCRHCIPHAPGGIGVALCDAEERRLMVGKYAPKEEERAGNGECLVRVLVVGSRAVLWQ